MQSWQIIREQITFSGQGSQGLLGLPLQARSPVVAVLARPVFSALYHQNGKTL